MEENKKTNNIIIEKGKEISGLKIPRYNKNNIEKCQMMFREHILENVNNISLIKKNLISLSIKGELQDQYIRPTAWKIFLNFLPNEKEPTLKFLMEETLNKRLLFHKKLEEMKNNPEYILENEKINKELKSWANGGKSKSIGHLIYIDVERTNQDNKLFVSPYIKEIENNILMLYSKENKAISYKQGMNEILAMLIFALYPFYITSPVKNYSSEVFDKWIGEPSKYLNQIYSFFHDENEFQSDLYFLFCNIMKLGINRFYEDLDIKTNPLEKKTYLLKRCEIIIQKKLKKQNNKLYRHFIQIGLTFEIVLQRWLKCMFSREFPPNFCCDIWDNLLANESDNPSDTLEYADNFSIAMLDFISNVLLKKDQNDCFSLLFNYPSVQSIKPLLQISEKVKEDLKQYNLELQNKKAGNNLMTNFFFGEKTKEENEEQDENVVGRKRKVSISQSVGRKNSIKNNSRALVPPEKEEPIFGGDTSIGIMKAFDTNQMDGKTILSQLKKIINKYKSNFSSEDKTQVECLLHLLKKKI